MYSAFWPPAFQWNAFQIVSAPVVVGEVGGHYGALRKQKWERDWARQRREDEARRNAVGAPWAILPAHPLRTDPPLVPSQPISAVSSAAVLMSLSPAPRVLVQYVPAPANDDLTDDELMLLLSAVVA